MTLIRAELTDPRLDVFRELRSQTPSELAVAEGAVVVRRLLEQRATLQCLVCTPAQARDLEHLVPSATPIFLLEKTELSALAGFPFHRGCLAALPKPSGAALAEASFVRLRHSESVTIVVGHALSDPANVGALARNAVALGADVCVFDGASASPYGRRAIRASMGHVFSECVFQLEDLPSAIQRWQRETGVRVYATTPRAPALALDAVRWARRRLILFGHEGYGLSQSQLELADEHVCVPLLAGVDSLNVAATAAVVLYACRGTGARTELRAEDSNFGSLPAR